MKARRWQRTDGRRACCQDDRRLGPLDRSFCSFGGNVGQKRKSLLSCAFRPSAHSIGRPEAGGGGRRLISDPRTDGKQVECEWVIKRLHLEFKDEGDCSRESSCFDRIDDIKRTFRHLLDCGSPVFPSICSQPDVFVQQTATRLFPKETSCCRFCPDFLALHLLRMRRVHSVISFRNNRPLLAAARSNGSPSAATSE